MTAGEPFTLTTGTARGEEVRATRSKSPRGAANDQRGVPAIAGAPDGGIDGGCAPRRQPGSNCSHRS
jgi:hypothetical protein